MSSIASFATPIKPKRRWYQYSMRTMFVVVTVAGCGFGWLGLKVRDVQRQKAAVDAIEALGGTVWFDYQWHVEGDVDVAAAIPGPAWLRSLIGDDYFRTATFAELWRGGSTPPAYLEDFPQLERLDLLDTDLTDSGLEHLRGLRRLTILVLDCPRVTDTGLEHLQGLTHLKDLWLNNASVTDAGVAKLKQALPDCAIHR